MNKIVFNSILAIGILMFNGHVFSQTTDTKVADSTAIAKTVVVDSMATNKIVVADSTAKSNKRLKFGMGFGLNFVGGTNMSLSPNLVYSVSDKVSLGGGIQGSYTSVKDLQSTITFGFNVIGFYSPIKKITTLLEFTELNVTRKTETPTGENKDTFWDTAIFVGAGVNVTNKITVGAKYNMLYKADESVYTSAVIPFVNISF